nr:hypothetical protein HGMM_F01C09C48 [uncultured Gammaproteobacteria bacterium]
MDRRGTLNWQPGSKPWSLALDSLTLEDCALALADRGLTLALSLDVLARSIEVRNLCNDGKTPAEFKAAFALKQGGAITIDGQLGLDLGSASAKLTASWLNLSPLAPYVAHFTTLRLASGEVSAAGQLVYAKPAVGYTGSLSVAGLRLDEAASGERFLAWRSLSADCSFGLAPDHLDIAQVSVL